MSQTYSVTGINLKSMALGEADRLLTMLTPEVGLLRAVASGARKQNSKLGGRTALFVVNDCLIAKGRTLDRLVQAETRHAFKGLSRTLSRLTASQYLAELALIQALENQPQVELFQALQQGLRSLELCNVHQVLAQLVHHSYQLLALAGLAPEVQVCCRSRQPIHPNFFDSRWSVEFNVAAGGTVLSDATQPSDLQPTGSITWQRQRPALRLSALQLAFMQQLHRDELPETGDIPGCSTPWNHDTLEVFQAWFTLERVLREYIQYHFERPIRSAELLATSFLPPTHSPSSPPVQPHAKGDLNG